MPTIDYVPLFQETWRRRPFWMIVGCILVNRTKWAQARSIHADLVSVYRDHLGLMTSHPKEIERMVGVLGLKSHRCLGLRGFAWDWTLHHLLHNRRPTTDELRGMRGVGQYAADTWAIFIEHRQDVEPTDKRLKEYLENRRREVRRRVDKLMGVFPK